MLNRRLFVILAAAIVLLAMLLGRPFAAHSDNGLFAPRVGRAAIKPGDVSRTDDALRLRAVDINWGAITPRTDEISLNLFPDVTLNARIRRVDEMVNGGFVWVGDVEGDLGGSVTLSVQDGILAGSIYRGGIEWGAIRYAAGALGDAHLVVELDPHNTEPSGPDYVIPQPSTGELHFLNTAQAETCQEDGSEIGVMIVYTLAARNALGGTAAIEALINQRISEMNSANDVSLVNFDWRLVHTMEVNYAESASLQTDLDKLMTIGDAVMDEVHTARNTYKADLVAMLVDEGNNDACGMAYLLRTMEPWFASYSFGVVALDYPGEDYTCSSMALTHELGHNLGNAHDRANSGGDVLFPYSYGYQSPAENFRDIMSYNCSGGCPRINQWANPDVWYMDEPTGIDYEADPGHAADLARSMDQSRILASNFRADCSAQMTPTSNPTNTPKPVDTSTPTYTPANTPTSTYTPTPSSTSTPPNTPTPTYTPTPTSTLSPTSTSTPTSTPTKEAGITPSPSATSVGNPADIRRLFLPVVIED